jgi:hypothetical protein
MKLPFLLQIWISGFLIFRGFNASSVPIPFAGHYKIISIFSYNSLNPLGLSRISSSRLKNACMVDGKVSEQTYSLPNASHTKD